MEQYLVDLLREYGYIVLYFWSILEGETGLFMAGLLAHDGSMSVPLAILVAGLGAFTGDQIYFYIGRLNRRYVQRKFKNQRTKFALAHLLLKKYGWPLIFVQRYMVGLRTIIPISIGLTRYPAKLFGLVNFISGFFWASMTILPTWYFGEEILEIIKVIKAHWYFALPLIGGFFYGVYRAIMHIENNILDREKRKQRRLKRQKRG